MKKNSDTTSSLRPPIVVVLGHVDHGKTTLLDSIRKTNVAAREAGGITQSIGASQVITKDGKVITFIDTPGHAAFAKMRSRGAKVADIAVLVVAADDGVKPQTKEALEYTLAADIPFIVAATKVDLPSAEADTVRNQLEGLGVAFEGRGGDVPLVSVSGKTGQGIDSLLEMINLVAEMDDVKGDAEANLEAYVIETGKDKRGPYASLVIKNGSLKVGDEIVSETQPSKVRGIFNYLGNAVAEAKPGEPVQVLGFSQPPQVGSRIWHKGSQSELPAVREVHSIQKTVEEDKIPILIKARNAGSLEAVLASIPASFYIIESQVGDVTESDVFLAKSANADIFAFESKTPTSVARLAETEGVSVHTFSIIYELFERLDDILKKAEIEISGKAQILSIFPFDNKRIAGCKVLTGKISKGDALQLTRNEKPIGSIKVVSMKKAKVDVNSVSQGEEFGMLFTPQLEFKVGDVILSVREKK